MRADDPIRARCRHPSGTFAPFPRAAVEGSITDLFEAQARRYADRTAIRTADLTLTYDALNRDANRIAHAVLDACGPDEGAVALLVADGAAFAGGSLGLVKAGKVQVPLEGSYPRARLAYMLEQSGARAILTTDADLALARELAGPALRVVNLDRIAAGVSAANPGIALGPDSPAAIEYTSGSTGRPKGILRSHRGTLHDVMRLTAMARLCPDDRIVLPGRGLLPALHALLNGAAFYPVERGPDALSRLGPWLMRERVTVFRAAVSAFRSMAGALTGAEAFPDLRLIVLFGEPVYERDVELYRKHFGETCILVSTLGTSEFGDFTHFFVDRRTALPRGVVPAGYPAEDVEVVLVDEAGQPGADPVGEIAVRSRYGATCYWGMPELSATAFGVPDAAGRRIFRTGDLGQFEPDGCLVHLGRRDFQVKVNGNRVHVSEVEAALLDHEAVKAAAVVGREDIPGQVRLIAYLVLSGPAAPRPGALRRALEARLPAFMVPSRFVVVDALPLTATGKVDRRSLPAPDGLRPALETPYAPPGTPLEEALVAIWTEVLQLDRVGVADNFLDLGGDSLLATQVVSRVLDQFALPLPPSALLAAATVADMANMVLAGLLEDAGEGGLASVFGAAAAPEGSATAPEPDRASPDRAPDDPGDRRSGGR